MHDADFWRTTALGVAAVGQTVFAALYLTFPWWRNFLGRALFGKAVMLTVIIDSFWIARLFHLGQNDTFFIALYAALSVGVWAEVWAFVNVMLRGKRKDWAQETDAEHDTRGDRP